jgi:cephalosporin hydroxylase
MLGRMADRPPRAPDSRPEPEVRDPEYARTYSMTLAEWILYHQDTIVFEKVRWMGVPALKNPLDCWIYQEIVWDTKPEVLVEDGSLTAAAPCSSATSSTSWAAARWCRWTWTARATRRSIRA